jgi:hypothetical protein
MSGTFDYSDVVVEVYAGPKLVTRSLPRGYVNGWDVCSALRGGGAGGAGGDPERELVVAAAEGAAEADFDTWGERVGLEEDVLLTREAPTRTTQYVVPSETARVSVRLLETSNAKMDLLVTDTATGRRIGFLTEEGREVGELAGSSTGTRGPDEWISLAVTSGQALTIRAALSLPDSSGQATGDLRIIERPLRPAILGVSTEEIERYVTPESSSRILVTVAELGGEEGLRDVRVSFPALEGADGGPLLAQSSPLCSWPYVDPGERVSVDATYDVPLSATGAYEGIVRVSAADTPERSVPLSIHVDGDAPETSFATPPLFETGTGWTFRWTGSDRSTPEDKLLFQFRVEGREDEWCLPIGTTEAHFPGLPDGRYRLLVRAIDLAGNIDASPAALSFSVPAQELFFRGDANADGNPSLDLSDAISIFAFLFTGGVTPPCMKAADATDDGAVDISDGIRILNYLFLGSVDLVDPFKACGLDLTEENLSCGDFPSCR